MRVTVYPHEIPNLLYATFFFSVENKRSNVQEPKKNCIYVTYNIYICFGCPYSTLHYHSMLNIIYMLYYVILLFF